jgi:uncharacterized OB-fold protein
MNDWADKDKTARIYSKRKLKKMKKSEIIEIAKELGLSISGSRAELIEGILRAVEKGKIESEGTEEKEEMECPECGYLLEPDDAFCPGCGYEIKKREEKLPPSPPERKRKIPPPPPEEEEKVPASPEELQPPIVGKVSKEELENYECPECGRLFDKPVPVCPDCGAEFELEEYELEEAVEKEKELERKEEAKIEEELPPPPPEEEKRLEEITCPKCGASLIPEDEYCPNCFYDIGEREEKVPAPIPPPPPLEEEAPPEKLEEIECPECGSILVMDDDFCPTCGFEIEKKEEELPPEPVAEEEERILEEKIEVNECPECGYIFKLDDTFCPDCGYEVKKREETYSKRKLKKMKKSEIIEIAENLGLLTLGTKAELIVRILRAVKEGRIEPEEAAKKGKMIRIEALPISFEEFMDAVRKGEIKVMEAGEEEIECPECGNILKRDDTFCAICGYKIKKELIDIADSLGISSSGTKAELIEKILRAVEEGKIEVEEAAKKGKMIRIEALPTSFEEFMDAVRKGKIKVKEPGEEEIECPECRNILERDDTFCPVCGYKIKKRGEKIEIEAPPTSFVGFMDAMDEGEIEAKEAGEEEIECPECGSLLAPDDEFCPTCGFEIEREEVAEALKAKEDVLEEYECPECGFVFRADEEFCPGCGLKIDWMEIKVVLPTPAVEEEEVPTFIEAVPEAEEPGPPPAIKYSKTKLKRKKKAELIEIANSLGISSSGTKAEIIERILKGVEKGEAELEEEEQITLVSPGIEAERLAEKEAGLGITNGIKVIEQGLTNGLTNGLINGLRTLKIGVTNGITNGNAHLDIFSLYPGGHIKTTGED